MEMGSATSMTDFKTIQDDLEAAAKRSEKWEKMVQLDLERQRQKEERRKKRQQLIAEGKVPLINYQQLVEMKEQKIKEQQKIFSPSSEAMQFKASTLQQPDIYHNLPNDTAEFQVKLAPPQRHHQNQASPYRKQIMGQQNQQPVKSSPLARGCSNVYDMSFEEDDMDGISQLDARGTIGSIAQVLGDDVKYL